MAYGDKRLPLVELLLHKIERTRQLATGEYPHREQLTHGQAAADELETWLWLCYEARYATDPQEEYEAVQRIIEALKILDPALREAEGYKAFEFLIEIAIKTLERNFPAPEAEDENADIIILIDDDGEQHRMVLLAIVDHEGHEYAMLTKPEQLYDEEGDELEIFLFIYTVDDHGLETYGPIEDDDTFQAVSEFCASLFGSPNEKSDND